MFFGNMQSFYRRNSLHNKSPNHVPTGGHTSKEQGIRSRRMSKHLKKDSYDEKSTSENPESALEEGINRSGIPVIKIGFYNQPEITGVSTGEENKDTFCGRKHPESDNSIRLGPNRNNIIRESLKSEIEKKNESGKP